MIVKRLQEILSNVYTNLLRYHLKTTLDINIFCILFLLLSPYGFSGILVQGYTYTPRPVSIHTVLYV